MTDQLNESERAREPKCARTALHCVPSESAEEIADAIVSLLPKIPEGGGENDLHHIWAMPLRGPGCCPSG